MNKTHHLIKRSALKVRVFAMLAERRPHLANKFTCVSAEFLDRAEGHFIKWLEAELDEIPTTGKTVRPAFARVVNGKATEKQDPGERLEADLTRLIGYPPVAVR